MPNDAPPSGDPVLEILKNQQNNSGSWTFEPTNAP